MDSLGKINYDIEMNETTKFERIGKDIDSREELFKKIDRKSTEILLALAGAPIYKKFGTVIARQAIPGEVVKTILNDGREETASSDKGGDVVVTNSTGEQYILSAETFASRYVATTEDGVFSANGYVRAIKNPFETPIEISASWGEPQYGDEECLILDICDDEGNNMAGEPYLIDVEVFSETYK